MKPAGVAPAVAIERHQAADSKPYSRAHLFRMRRRRGGVQSGQQSTHKIEGAAFILGLNCEKDVAVRLKIADRVAEVRTAQCKLYLLVAIDRTSKFAFVELHEEVARRTAGDFLRR